MGLGIKTKIIKSIRQKEFIPIEHPVSTDNQFEGKVALISGGTGGIGLAISRSLLESGCKVIVAGTNEKKLSEIKAILGDNSASLQMNYAEPTAFDKKIKEASEIFGKIDIFINSAGIHTEHANFWTIDPDEFDRVMAINLKGAYFACQAVGKYMRENAIKGHILIISSSRGSEPAWSPYGISKWGLKGLTEGLAKMFLDYGIIVNTIAPGSTATKLIGVGEGDSIYSAENGENRHIMPDEVATLAKLLVSDAGNMIVGETVHISGGRGVFDIR
jgi:NAD(P)-dependent dehydrogenase (short-subunit alcohol dehydrogenase family)